MEHVATCLWVDENVLVVSQLVHDQIDILDLVVSQRRTTEEHISRSRLVQFHCSLWVDESSLLFPREGIVRFKPTAVADGTRFSLLAFARHQSSTPTNAVGHDGQSNQ